MSAPSSDTAAIRQIIRALKAADHTLIAVNDGGERIGVTGEQEAIEAFTAVDMAWLYVRLPDGDQGWISFVLGNEPEEVAADWTINLSPVLDPLTKTWWS